MNSTPSPCSDHIFKGSGVIRYAVTGVGPVEPAAIRHYNGWIAAGRHAGMSYLERYSDIRANPALLLPGAKSMICCAIAYPTPHSLPRDTAKIAAYALGRDYHEVVRERLSEVAMRLQADIGGHTRVCVDTAPLRERYWAARSGLGFIGRNNHLIIPGLGSCFFLGEILTTVQLPDYSPETGKTQCLECGKCIRHCPTGALRDDGCLDASKCLSYLTIEHRGDFNDTTDLHGRLYGCDICSSVCPHNINAAPSHILPELMPRPALLGLTPRQVAQMTQQEFSTLFSHSAIKRAKLAGLVRNAVCILKKSGPQP